MIDDKLLVEVRKFTVEIAHQVRGGQGHQQVTDLATKYEEHILRGLKTEGATPVPAPSPATAPSAKKATK